MEDNFITSYSLLSELVLLLLVLILGLGFYLYRRKKEQENQLSESSKKRLDRLFEEMGERHFANDRKARMVWNRIHLILKGLNYDSSKLKKLARGDRKSPEMIFIKKNYQQIEKLITRYQALPEIKLAYSSSKKLESKRVQTPLKLI